MSNVAKNSSVSLWDLARVGVGHVFRIESVHLRGIAALERSGDRSFARSMPLVKHYLRRKQYAEAKVALLETEPSARDSDWIIERLAFCHLHLQEFDAIRALRENYVALHGKPSAYLERLVADIDASGQ